MKPAPPNSRTITNSFRQPDLTDRSPSDRVACLRKRSRDGLLFRLARRRPRISSVLHDVQEQCAVQLSPTSTRRKARSALLGALRPAEAVINTRSPKGVKPTSLRPIARREAMSPSSEARNMTAGLPKGKRQIRPSRIFPGEKLTPNPGNSWCPEPSARIRRTPPPQKRLVTRSPPKGEPTPQSLTLSLSKGEPPQDSSP